MFEWTVKAAPLARHKFIRTCPRRGGGLLIHTKLCTGHARVRIRICQAKIRHNTVFISSITKEH